MQTSPKTAPKPVESREIYRGRSFSVVEEKLQLHTGQAITRATVQHHGAVVILPKRADGSLLLVRQYRHASGKHLLEFPAGTIEAGEEPLHCAQREIQEETQHKAAEWMFLGGFYSAPGFCSEFLSCYLATDLTPCQAAQDEDEDCVVVPHTITEVEQMILNQEIVDAKTIATLHLAQLHRAL
jgi:ADP-ribose pyrophosphatase